MKVRIPTPLRRLTAGQGEVEAQGTAIADVLADLETQFPGMQKRLFEEPGQLRRFGNIYLNEEDIRFLQGFANPVGDDDLLSIVPAIAGGQN